MVNMAFSMIKIIRSVKNLIKNDIMDELDMRIGIHTVQHFFFIKITKILVWTFIKGDVIGGIIGTDVVRYDIYGKDVLIANKMESNGIVGKGCYLLLFIKNKFN